MSDERVIVGLAVEDAGNDGDDVIAGSVIVPCMTCERFLYLAPTGQDNLINADSVICTRCMVRELREHGDELLKVEVLPGAAEELLDHMRKRGLL